MNQSEGLLQRFTRLFAEHRVAANLFMLLMILSGLWAVKKLNTQFFPTFELDLITVGIAWPGASAEDVESSIILPLEDALRSVDGVDTLYATSRQGAASVRIELEEGQDVPRALEQVKQQVDSLRSSLPEDSKEPVVQRIVRYDDIASVLVTSPTATYQELRQWVRRFEQQLLDLGVRKIDFIGLAEQQIAIEVPTAQLNGLGLTLDTIVDNIRQSSVDLPAGTAAKQDGERQIRSLSQQRDVTGFEQLIIRSDGQGRILRLGDIANISWRAKDQQVELSYQGQPAIIMQLQRAEHEDTLHSAALLQQWLEQVQPTLTDTIELVTFDERWELVKARIDLLLKNGLGGLVLVIAILFLFLNARVAFWVTLGIPVSFLATLAMLYLIGGSINMISLFGLIMALGIIVDDAIVVGEDTLTHVQMGESGLSAAIGGAHRMLAPVIASSLTTIAAFLPLLMIGGIIGNILIDIPTVVICVIIASLVECFLVLPGHLRHSLRNQLQIKPSPLRQALDQRFNHFKEQRFRRLVRAAIRWRWATLATALALFIIALGLVMGGRVKFTFFPSVESDALTANVQFSAGMSAQPMRDFIDHLDQTLRATEQELGETVLVLSVREYASAHFPRSSALQNQGDSFGALYVELSAADQRQTSNRQLIHQWREKIQLPAGVEKFSIDQGTSGPPGKPIEIKLSGSNVDQLKQASQQVQALLRQYPGLSNIGDDLPYGTSQLIYQLTPQGKAAGLTLTQVGRQLRAAFEGIEVQTFYQGQDEISVNVRLPEHERDRLQTLDSLPVVLSNGSTTPLANLVTFSARRGIDSLPRIDGQLSINVSADLDESRANANEIIADLQAGPLEQLIGSTGIRASFEGKSRNQRETLGDMQMGLLLALTLIYIILAWVFDSYRWPIAVMLAIPLGLTGAVFGHFVCGLDLTILSLFGLFGLSGIVINDSIVLITFYKQLRARGIGLEQAIEDAACQRLRAVLLTSLTTIAGLTPILFETSLQAQFLIPMATSIVFGLAYGTFLILLFVPALLSLLDQRRKKITP